MKMFAISIGEIITESSFIFCQCHTIAEARATADSYRRQRRIAEPIQRIIEIPATLKDDDGGRRKYAAMGG